MTRTPRRRRRSLGAVGTVLLLGANVPLAVNFISAQIHRYEITRPSYERRYGAWQTLVFPTHFRVHSVHAALLRTGNVLMMAGSGNDVAHFKAGTFRTLEWDPLNNRLRLVPTPSDVFCGGHAFLPSGNLLIAGGTERYEELAGTVTHAGGAMHVINDTDQPITIPKDTDFIAANGRKYLSDVTITVPPAHQQWVGDGRHRARITRVGEVPVWVDAVKRGRAGRQRSDVGYSVTGFGGRLAGVGEAMTQQKQDFQGTNLAYEFDAAGQHYDAVERMIHKRWYPSLVELSDGDVMAVSGLDGVGNISDGHTEIFNPRTERWSAGPVRYFPTYPALFLTAGGNLFYSAADTGFGPAHKARTAGIWNLKTDAFTPVPGLKDPNEVETAASLLLPPAQSQKVMILGGGGVGQSRLSTRRTAIVDLKQRHPRWQTGPSLPHQTRYPLAVVLPNDTVFVTGGSRFYRGEHDTNNRDAEIYNPSTNTLQKAATPSVGRDYHSEVLLLPDGRVATFGSNPLFSDQADEVGAQFEQRVEIYSPPYLFKGPRPRITGGPHAVRRGVTVTYTIPDSSAITKLRLIHPGAYTHVTDSSARSVAVPFTRTQSGVRAAIPASAGLLPSGWYMLFADNGRGVPSVARWVKVS
jgi:hypothetical protein